MEALPISSVTLVYCLPKRHVSIGAPVCLRCVDGCYVTLTRPPFNLGAKALRTSRKHHNAIVKSSRFLSGKSSFYNRSTNLTTKRVRKNLFAGKDAKTGDSDLEKLDAKTDKDLFVRWSVPWDGKTVILTMTTFGLSFLLTGLSLSVLIARLGFGRRQGLGLDEQAILIFTSQFLQTIVGTAVIQMCIRNYGTLPNEFFNYDWRNPFDVRRGWLLWGVVGVFFGAASVLFAGTLATAVNGEPLAREEQDSLLQLLPLIGASRMSTALLVGVTGLLAPYLEETVFRGFLMTSLTKWMPTSVAVILSAGIFAVAHFTPGEIPQLFALGVVLGFAYAKTRNLLTPIMIHALWNSGVILLLAFLRVQGYNIQELI